MPELLHVMDLGRQRYAPVHALQEQLVAERGAGSIPDTLVLVEHEPVYSMGRRAKDDNILASVEQRARLGIEVVHTGRGGDVTYHGPGQLVGYPILDLADHGGGAVWYVSHLEETLIRTLAAFGVEAGTDPINRGVWVGREKIAAIGVRISRKITMHGFALNVNPNMQHYDGIVPCGIQGRGVTALHRFRPDLSLADVARQVALMFQTVFGYERVEWPAARPLPGTPPRAGELI